MENLVRARTERHTATREKTCIIVVETGMSSTLIIRQTASPEIPCVSCLLYLRSVTSCRDSTFS